MPSAKNQNLSVTYLKPGHLEVADQTLKQTTVAQGAVLKNSTGKP